MFPIIGYFVELAGGSIDYELGATPRFDKFSIMYCSFITAAVLFPLLIKKDIGFLIKINSLGVYFAMILILYVIYTGIKSMIITDFVFAEKSNVTTDGTKYLLLFGPNPFKLAGSITLGYCSHTFVLSIIRNNKVQENNTRDLALGYSMVGVTYLLTGLFGYIGFSGKGFNFNFMDVS